MGYEDNVTSSLVIILNHGSLYLFIFFILFCPPKLTDAECHQMREKYIKEIVLMVDADASVFFLIAIILWMSDNVFNTVNKKMYACMKWIMKWDFCIKEQAVYYT